MIIKISAGMTGEFEIIKTDAPLELISAQLQRNSSIQENGDEIENAYDLLEQYGYSVVVLTESRYSQNTAYEVGNMIDYYDYN